MVSPLLVPPELNAATKLQNTWPMFRTSDFRSGFISYGSQRMGYKDENVSSSNRISHCFVRPQASVLHRRC